MKTTKHWVWTMSALAVLATPTVFAHFNLVHKEIFRSIASEESKSSQTDSVVEQEAIEKLNKDIQAEQEKTVVIQTQLDESLASPADSLDQNEKKQVRVSELEEAIKSNVSKIDELEAQIKSMEERAKVNSKELEATKLSLNEAKIAAEFTLVAFEDANQEVKEARIKLEANDALIAEKEADIKTKKEELEKKAEELLAKDAEIAEREERLTHKREELRMQKEKHDIFVCESEFKFTALTKQIEELNTQQQQFTQVMLGLNQVLLGFMGQLSQQNQQGSVHPMGQGFNYFAQGYMPNASALGQMQSPWQNTFNGQYSFNPGMSQQQYQQPSPQVINNYYGSFPQAGMSQQQQGQPFMMEQQQPYYMPGSFNFEMPGIMNDGRPQVEFGNFQGQQQVKGPLAQTGFMPQIFN